LGGSFVRNLLILLALPSEAREVCKFNSLRKGLGNNRSIECHGILAERPKLSRLRLSVHMVSNRSGKPPPPTSKNPGTGETVRGAFRFDLFGKKIAAHDSRSDGIRQELCAKHRRLAVGAEREVRPASAD
jgi:hypothetical protein